MLTLGLLYLIAATITLQHITPGLGWPPYYYASEPSVGPRLHDTQNDKSRTGGGHEWGEKRSVPSFNAYFKLEVIIMTRL
jgi:hypothetical protein